MSNYYKNIIDRLKILHLGMFAPKANLKTQIFFVKRLSFLIRAEVPLLEALTILCDQSESKRVKKIMQEVCLDVSNGQQLSKSFRKHTGLLSVFAIQIVEIGEYSGTLSENLEYLAQELHKRNALRKKIMGAFVYPVVVLIATCGITLFLILYLFPKIIPVFTSLHVKLPLSTRILIVVSKYIHDYWLITVCAGALVSTLVVYCVRRSNKLSLILDRTLLRIPIVNSLIKSYNLAHITRMLGLLLKSGLPVSEALPIASDIIHNRVYKEELVATAQAVRRGETMSLCFKKQRNIFPDVTVHVISVGEKSGNLSESLVYLSDFFEQEINNFTKNLGVSVEPVLMIAMGLVVGFIAISIIAPIYGITQNLHA